MNRVMKRDVLREDANDTERQEEEETGPEVEEEEEEIEMAGNIARRLCRDFLACSNMWFPSACYIKAFIRNVILKHESKMFGYYYAIMTLTD